MKKSEATRLTILEKAYELIYRNGYQTTSIDDILATTKVTKGAFYYHFKNKDEMGIAIINEILRPKFLSWVTRTFDLESNTLEALYIMVTMLLSDNDFLTAEQGCPLSNFIQEMTPQNTAFAKVLGELTVEWENLIISHIETGKKAGFVHADVQPKPVALFIISSYWGIRNFGRLESGSNAYRSYLKELKNYLNSLQ